MRILALGCGDMGRMAIAVLLDSPIVSSITVADINIELAKAVVELVGSDKLSAFQIDINDKENLVKLMLEHDVVMNTVGPFYKFAKPVIEAVIKAKKPLIDICDDWKPTLEVLEMDQEAKDAGITAVIGIGASPGITNLLAVLAGNEFDEVEEITTAWGVKLMKEGKKPLHYVQRKKLKKSGIQLPEGSAALVHLFYECVGKIPTYRNGEMVEIEALTEAQPFEFPGFRKIKPRHVGHPEPVTLSRTINASTISNVMFLGTTITNALMTLKERVEKKELTIKEAAIEFENIERKMRKPLNLLRIFFKELINHPPILCVNATGIKDGRRKKIALGLSRAPFDEMAGVTGVPLAITTIMLAEGKILAKGILTPEEAIDPVDFFNRLAQYCGKNLEGKDILIKEEIDI
ncbi:MAG: saccharopine dehydrogenase family protein [Candidatus Hodarchaeota archaeon]